MAFYYTYMEKDLFHRLLDFYQIDEAEYERITAPVSLENFYDGHQFDDIENAVSLVKDVLSSDGKILVYGDYDADGIMGTSILAKMFQYLGKERTVTAVTLSSMDFNALSIAS